MTDIATLGFNVDTRGLIKGESGLNSYAKTGEKTEKRMSKSIDNTNSEFVRLGNTVGIVAAAMIGFNLVSRIASVTDANKEFAKSISQLSAITGAVGKDLEFYKKQALDIGANTTLSATQAAQAFKLMASAKPDLLASADALNAVTREAVVLAEATGIDLPSAAKALGSTLNQFGLDASKASEVINVLAASSKLGTASVASISESLINAGAAANTLGVSFTETVAGLQALAKAGIDGASAGTALNQIMLRLERSGNQKLMPSIVGLESAISELNSMNMSTTESMKFFGDEAFKSAAALLGQEETLKQLNQTLAGTKVAYEQAATTQDNWAGDLAKLNSATESLAISIGEGLNPALRSSTQSMTELVSNTEALADAGVSFISIMGIGAVGALAKSTAASVSQTIASISSAKAMHTSSLAALGLAKSEVALLHVQRASFAASIAQIKNERIRDTFRMRLVATTTALTAAETKLAAANTAVATTATAAAIGTRALGVASRFLLGPWGLLITAIGVAASVFVTSKDNSDELASSLETQKGAVSDLEKAYSKLSNKAIGSAYIDAQKTLISIDQQRLDIQEKMVKASNLGISGVSQFAALARQLKDLNESAVGPEQRLQAIQDIFTKGIDAIKWIDPVSEAAKTAEKVTKEYQKFLDTVNGFQSPMDKLLSNLAMVNAALTSGALQPNAGVVGYIASLSAEIAKLNVVASEDNSYQKWVDEITGSSTASKLQTLQDEITDVWIAMDAGDIDTTTGLEYIEAMEEKIKSLQKTLSGADMFNMIGDSAKEALGQVQGLAAQGSKEYAKLGVAIQAVSAVQAVFAVLNQASGDPYTAFARMASMVGAVASLGFSVGSVGGGLSDSSVQNQASQGLNVWGDKADSISKAIEMTASATEQLVGINTGMLKALQSLEVGISGAAGISARGVSGADFSFTPNIKENAFGNFTDTLVGDIYNVMTLGLFKPITDFIGNLLGGSSSVTDEGIQIMGGTFADIIDGAAVFAFKEMKSKKYVWSSTKTNTELFGLDEAGKQFSLVFGALADTVFEGGKALGLSTGELERSINKFEIATTKISLKDLSVDEQQTEIEAVFSKIFDDLAGSVIPFIDELQRTGEGLGETLARVAAQVQIAEFAAKNLGFTLSDKLADPKLFAQVADNLSMMVGGIEAFASKTASFIDTFAPESVKFDIASSAINEALSEVGLMLPDTAEAFFELMKGATPEQVAALLNAQGSANDYYDLLEDRNEKASSDLASQMALEEKAANELQSFNNSLLSLSASLRGAIVGIYGTEVATSQLSLTAALEAARLGDFSKALDLNLSNLSPSMEGFESLTAFNIEQAITANKLAELADLTALTATSEDMMLTANQEQVALLTSINSNIATAYVPEQTQTQNNDTLIIEIKALRSEMEDIKHASQATAKNTQSSADDLDQITRDGIEVRLEA